MNKGPALRAATWFLARATCLVAALLLIMFFKTGNAAIASPGDADPTAMSTSRDPGTEPSPQAGGSDANTAPSPRIAGADPDTAPSLGVVKVTAALLATLACIFVVAAIIRRTPLGGRSGGLRLENRLTLARGGSLAVVRIEGRRLVLGVTPGQINLIAELDEAVAGDRDTLKAGGFERLLGGLLHREGASQ